MDKQAFTGEVERRFRLMFMAAKEGHKTHAAERYQLEGFIQAGIFLGLTGRAAMQTLMEQVHIEVFDKTLQERAAENLQAWPQDEIDYNRFDRPAYERR